MTLDGGTFQAGAGMAITNPFRINTTGGTIDTNGNLLALPTAISDGFSGRIEVVEPTGPDTQLLVRVAGAPLVVLLRSRTRAAAGEAMPFNIDPAEIHLFDAGSGTRIDAAR